MEYELLDCGHFQKLERFGQYTLMRPSTSAVWKPRFAKQKWRANAQFARDLGSWQGKIPDSWTISIEGMKLLLKPTDFGHLGIFPEHAMVWRDVRNALKGKKAEVLNLFAYSGALTVCALQEGASVCHLDAAKGMVDWARENACLNNLENAPCRWIVDDALKFVKREVRRGKKYDLIILDPPTFGRGRQGQVFKIEDDLPRLLEECVALLSDRSIGIILSCHTPGFTPQVLENLLYDYLGEKGRYEQKQMELTAASGLVYPIGSLCCWWAE
jgi:23S rRNA (cytosine1962-C5)-methyltransferase